MFADQYVGRKVFITGHTGFKGSWLTAWLLELGAEVCGYSLDVPTSPSGFEAMGLAARIRDIRGDVRNAKNLCEAVTSFCPDVIFHLAAQALVRPSYEDPTGTFTTNAVGTMNLLEAARKTRDLKALVCITSDKCYRNDEWEWGYRETDHLGGADPYSASKACAEIIAHSYFVSFFNGTGSAAAATVRAGNVIGGGDWAVDRIVPDCARAYAEKRSVLLRNPLATRPWQHVLEPLSGYLWLGARLLLGDSQDLHAEAFNFGPPAEVNATVGQVSRALANNWPGFVVDEIPQADHAAKESTLLKLCCDKALARLDWKAVLTFDETIRYTADWYRHFYQPETEQKGMYSFTAEQVEAYTRLAQARGLKWAR